MKSMQVRSFLTIVLLLIGIICFAAGEVQVQGVGRAAGNDGVAREQALEDALRDAVRKGVGVNLISSTRVRGFVLGHDQVLTSSFGYVKDYKIIWEGPVKGGFYQVRVSAWVGKGEPGHDDLMVLRQLILRKKSPRVMIKVAEKFTGIKSTAPITAAILREMAMKIGLEVVDVTESDATMKRLARRDHAAGDKGAAAARAADITSKYDFVISADSTGEFSGFEEVYGIKTAVCHVGVEMKAIWPDTGETIAQVTVPSTEVVSSVTSPSQAMRDSLRRVIEGDPRLGWKTRGKSAESLFKAILAKWITELDRGRKVLAEFKGMDEHTLDKLSAGLKRISGIGNVWVREFVAGNLYTTIELQTRLEPMQIKKAVKKITGDKFRLYSFTRNRLEFLPVTDSRGKGANAVTVQPQPSRTVVESPKTDTQKAEPEKPETSFSIPVVPVVLGIIALAVFGLVLAAVVKRR